MAQSSPSEFLTFYRRIATSQALSRRVFVHQSSQPFSSFPIHRFSSEKNNDLGEPGKPKKHILEKDDDLNVQAYESKAGRANWAQGTGGVATEQKDPGKSATKKAKEEFPEAPTTIGFQDERGGKGH